MDVCKKHWLKNLSGKFKTNCKVITETFVCSELGGIFAMLDKLIAVMGRNKFL